MRRVYSTMIIFAALAIALAFTSVVEARVKQYDAMQVSSFVVDGKIDEWGTEDPVIILDELKDAGLALPDPDDFDGYVMVGWNDQDAERIYLVYVVIDDEIQDINDPGGNWWDDDSAEIIFDLQNNATREKWAIGATEQLSVLATDDNTEFVINVNEAINQYIYEIAITATGNFKADEGVTIGLSPIYNDCENGIREHQIGWIAGMANDSNNMGDINFVRQIRRPTSIEPSGKLATTWGDLKSR